MKQKTYIVAVSGGVDSVVLLHKLVRHQTADRSLQSATFVVAHFDHGIRGDSDEDAKLVKQLAQKYDLSFEHGQAKLGADVSEQAAREARYEFLEKMKQKYTAEAIITAHHQDDVLETMVLNILRGTGPRGLVGFTRPGIMRPLLARAKQELLDYAHEHNLEWREDSTNQDRKYLRNYVRLELVPKLKKHRVKLLGMREVVARNYHEIDLLVGHLKIWLMTGTGEIMRSRFVVLPFAVQCEVMASIMREVGIEIDRQMVERAVMAAKTLMIGRRTDLNRDAKLYSYKESVLLKIDPKHV